MIYAVLVSYYDDYYDKALGELKKICADVDKNYVIVVVNNNHNKMINNECNVDVIGGSNQSWEFSAWDEGVEYLNANYKVNSFDMCIFANDTFCHHRYYNHLSQKIFSYQLRKAKGNSKLLVGDICHTQDMLSIDGYMGDSWVSTYIFGTQLANIKNVGGFCSNHHEIVFEHPKIKIKRANEAMERHLSNWLLSSNGGWYKSGDVSENIVIKKTEAILNEKLLSFRLKKISNIHFVDIYKLNLIKRFYRLIYKYKNRC